MSGSRYQVAGRRAVGLGIACGLIALALMSLAGVAHGKGEYESNDSRETAYGPLQGGKEYVAEIDTENDVDWYLFYVKTYSQMEFASTVIKDVSGYCGSVYFQLYDKDGDRIGTFYSGHVEETERFNLTMDAGRYYLKTEDCYQGDRYRFKISPASSLTTSRSCGEAIIDRNEAAPELAKVTGLIANNTNSLAKVDGVIAKQNARLTGLTRHWRNLKRRWKRNRRKINRGNGSRYSKARARSRLSSSKRKANQRLAAKKRQPKAKLEKANSTREEILAKRLALQTLGAQHTGAVAQADQTIADDC